MTTRSTDEFFVGYLPVPPRLRRFLWGVALGLAVLFLGLASLGALQRSPGTAFGKTGWGEEVTGLVVVDPYPMLVTVDESGAVEHMLLAGGGKFGPSRRVAEKEGEVVTLKGNRFRRDGRSLLEVGGSPKEGSLAPAALATLQGAARRRVADVVLKGQIMDAKCYHGRMRPGEGRMHRACAQYCIHGGIPPILVTRDETGQATHYLLETAEGGRANEQVFDYVAEPVVVAGALFQREDLWVLRIESLNRL